MEAGGVVLVVHQLMQEANKHQSMEALVVEEALQAKSMVVSLQWDMVVSNCPQVVIMVLAEELEGASQPREMAMPVLTDPALVAAVMMIVGNSDLCFMLVIDTMMITADVEILENEGAATAVVLELEVVGEEA